MRKIIDLTGRKYGRWTVIKKSDHRYADRVVKWLCQCACGNQREVIGHTLKSGKSRSCGCLAIDLGRKQSGIFSGHYKHGGARRTGKVRLYRIWQNIKKRCNKPNHPDYKYYGAKGISLCDEWQDDFEAFRDWALSNGYQDNLTIDRINSRGDYKPDNCQWLSLSENVSKAQRELAERRLQYG